MPLLGSTLAPADPEGDDAQQPWAVAPLHRPRRSRRAEKAQRLKSGSWPRRRGQIHPKCCTGLCLAAPCTHWGILQRNYPQPSMHVCCESLAAANLDLSSSASCTTNMHAHMQANMQPSNMQAKHTYTMQGPPSAPSASGAPAAPSLRPM